MIPTDLGLPPKFTGFRPNQEQAIFDAAASDRRFECINAPVGSGKSVIYMGIRGLLGGVTAILTSTKGLMAQLVREFPDLAEIKGQNNYRCVLEQPRTVYVDEGVCHVGVSCALKGGGCTYYDAYRAAIRAQAKVTNYSYWLTVHQHSEGLGPVDTLVMDEAHNAPDELADFLTIRITDRQIDAFLHRSRPSVDPASWASWAYGHRVRIEAKVYTMIQEAMRWGKVNPMLLRTIKEHKAIVKLLKIVEITKDSTWIFEDGGQFGDLTWSPVSVAPYGETLFQGIRKVILVSATVRPKTLDMLGIPPEERNYREYPSTFARARRPVIHVPTVRMNFGATKLDLQTWLDRIDQIIGRRLDRKGIIHTVSYDRRDFLLRNSRFKAYMMTHQRRDTAAVVAKFKLAPAPAILISPALSTGWDFPYEECEYQIIGKIGFPDHRTPLNAARAQIDRDYTSFVAVVDLVQAVGRGMRAADDRCETLVVDDVMAAPWFRRKLSLFAPRWFMESFQRVDSVPAPPPKLMR